jgi:hypothetical protein
MKMKNLFILAILSIATTAAAQEGTSSVLVNAPEATTPAVASPAVTVTPAPAACCETAKLAKLPAWQVRRLNRIADRQEAREARKCCCDPCECEKADACKCRTKAVVVEARH